MGEVLGASAAACDAHDVADAAAWCTDGAASADLVERSQREPFVMQFRSDVEIVVDGDEARAESLVIAPTSQVVDGTLEGWWRSVRQTVRLVRTSVGWRIAELAVEPIISARYEDGWGAPTA